MKRGPIARAAAVAVLLVLLAACQGAPGDDAAIEEYRERIAQLEAENRQLETEVTDLGRYVEELQALLEGRAPGAPRPWSQEGLEFSWEMEALKADPSVPEGYSPDYTEWTENPEVLSALSEDPGIRGPEPGILVGSLAAHLGGETLGQNVWQVTARAFRTDPDRALGIVMLWGFKDDSTAGRDYRLHMRETDGTWEVTRVDVRQHCWRGVTGGLCR